MRKFKVSIWTRLYWWLNNIPTPYVGMKLIDKRYYEIDEFYETQPPTIVEITKISDRETYKVKYLYINGKKYKSDEDYKYDYLYLYMHNKQFLTDEQYKQIEEEFNK